MSKTRKQKAIAEQRRLRSYARSRGCPSSKRCYPDEPAALRGLSNAQRRIRGKKIPIRVYKCECGFWHTTSIPIEEFKNVH